MKHVILYGPPGVGKLTVAQGVEEKLGFPVLHNHLTIDAVVPFFEFGSPIFMKLIRKFRLDIISEIAATQAPGLLQTSCFSLERLGSLDHIREIKNVVESAGGVLLCIQITADPSILRARVKQPDRASYGKITEPDKLDEVLTKTDFFSPMPSELHTKTITSSEQSVEATIKDVIQCIVTSSS